MATNENANGVILWEGSSAIDGSPIVVIATGLAKGSSNTKTGAQIQTFILRADMPPLAALKSGADKAICGDCAHRPVLAAAQIAKGEAPAARCYVAVFNAPRSVWLCYKRGGYRAAEFAETPQLFAGMNVRLGSYGDPAAAPFEVWDAATSRAASVTGYTHQWRDCDARFSGLTMASTDSADETRDAWAQGWRTFEVAAIGTAPIAGKQIACPASKEMGQKTQCAACKACGGSSSKARASVMIWDHSSAGVAKARRFQLTRNGARLAA